VCVDGITYKVWMVEEVGGDVDSNSRRTLPSDAWSEEVTSEEGGEEDHPDEDSDTSFSFSLELSSKKLPLASNHWSDDKTSGHDSIIGPQLSPLDINHLDDTCTDGPEDKPNSSYSPKPAKADHTSRKDEKAHESYCTKGVISNKEKAASREHVHDPAGKILNCEDRESEAQGPYKENLGDIRHAPLPLNSPPPQNQICNGPTGTLGPFREKNGSNKAGLLPIAHTFKTNSEMHSKVYVRQKHTKAKAQALEPVEEEPQLLKSDIDVEIMPASQDKSSQQCKSESDSGRGLKSTIECNTTVMEEAQQQWNLGKALGLEGATDQSIHIQNFANMEIRDREEALQLGNKKINR